MRTLTSQAIFLSVVACVISCRMVSVAGENVQVESETPRFKEFERRHWSFQPITHPVVPKAANSSWNRNPIDAFVASALEAKRIQPAPAADRISLLRRVSLDLTGLPPSPGEVRAFLADSSPDAFARQVDRLLASPHYGERWARHWLDLARYAESEGFKEDHTRPDIWRYRDYVINAFNADKPYDQFVQEQIAGDELWPDRAEARIATGFNRHYPDEHNARDLAQRRQEILNDITDTVGAVFTGLTFACARCHNHKFDPILQSDYYRLQAFFANVTAADQIPLASDAEVSDYRRRLADWDGKTAPLRKAMEEIEAPQRREIEHELIQKYPREIQEAIAKKPADRTSFEWLMYYKARQYLDPESYLYVAPASAIVGQLKPEAKKKWEELKRELDQSKSLHPERLPFASGIIDGGPSAPSTHVLFRGSYEKPREEVAPGFLQILNPAPAQVAPPAGLVSTGRRSALAKILTDPKNPLTARVMVNRIWHYHFGRGMVATPSDFGLKGDRPSHPELLDWLAGEFIRSGWSVKHIHRLILNSRTYQQSSAYRATAARIDPDDKLFWRFPPRRLEGEVIRDSALAISGRLNPSLGGPSVFPALPPGMEARGGWKMSEDEAERNRRSIYVFVKRNSRYPMLEAFDMPDTHESCSRRNLTTTPLQALTLLNSELTLDWARSFAERVISMAGQDSARQIDAAFQLAYGRKPDGAEKRMVRDFFKSQGAIIAERLAAGEAIGAPCAGASDPATGAALVDFCHMLINSNEFVYLN